MSFHRVFVLHLSSPVFACLRLSSPFFTFLHLQGWDAAGFGATLVVGSLSTHPPEMAAGGSSSATAVWPDPDDEAAAYMEAANGHRISGVDMIWLEMMKDEDHAPRAVKAAASSKLPVMMGIR